VVPGEVGILLMENGLMLSECGHFFFLQQGLTVQLLSIKTVSKSEKCRPVFRLLNFSSTCMQCK